MNQQDEEIEKFLRQFQPVEPPALPEVVRGPRVRPVFWLAGAAAVIATIGIGILSRHPAPKPNVWQPSKPRAERAPVSDARLMEAVRADLATPLAQPMEPLLARFPVEKDLPTQSTQTVRQTPPRGAR